MTKKRLGQNPFEEPKLPFIKDSREEKAQTNSNVKTETKPKTETKSKPLTKPETLTNTFAETFVILSADDIKAKANRSSGSGKLEDQRKRQTYYLSPDEFKMVSALSKKSDLDKYEVVSAAVRMLCNYVFDEEKSKWLLMLQEHLFTTVDRDLLKWTSAKEYLFRLIK